MRGVVKTRDTMEEFARTYLPRQITASLMPFHKEILWSLFQGGLWDIMVPTLHGKSTLCNVVFPILSLASDPDGSHILVGINDRDAKSWLAVISDELTTNEELLRDFPWLARPKEMANRVWNKSEIMVGGRSVGGRNPSVAALGSGMSDIKGRRGMTICDDIEGKDARESPTKRERTYQWMLLEALRAYERPDYNPRRLFANIGTPFDPDSIHIRLANEHGFQVYRQPYKYAEDHPKYAGKYIWPAMKASIKEKKEVWSAEQFAIAMELDPKGGDESLLSYGEVAALAKKGQGPDDGAMLVLLDPASGSENRKADYAGVSAGRFSWVQGEMLPRVDLTYAEACRQDVIEQVHRAASLSAQYGNCLVIYEGNSQQNETYRSLFRHFHPETPIQVHMTMRQQKLDPMMGVGVVKRLLNENRLRAAGPHDGFMSLYKEISGFGRPGVPDHLMMSIWFGVRHVYEKQRRMNAPRVRMVTRGGYGSGFSRTIDLRGIKGRVA